MFANKIKARIYLSLFFAVFMYGAAGRPAPQSPGLAEVIIAALFLLGVGWVSITDIATGRRWLQARLTALEVFGLTALTWMASVPFVIGLAQGWDGADIWRDYVPIFFLFLPLLFLRLPAEAQSALKYGLGAAGVMLAARWWIQVNPDFLHTRELVIAEGPDYFLNSSAVLFAAVWWPFMALEKIAREKITLKNIMIVFSTLALSAVCVIPLVLTMHRAALALMALSVIIFVGWIFFRRPRLGWMILAAAAVASALMWDTLAAAWDDLARKTLVVGDNARLDEISAVLSQAAHSPGTFLFGEGWGGLLSNPAVGLWWVSYTHSFPSYMLLKTGLVGLAIMACYLAALVWRWRHLWRQDMSTALALLGPLSVGLFFHTSFKYLCFGFILSLLSAHKK